jgi:hypothetical protein
MKRKKKTAPTEPFRRNCEYLNELHNFAALDVTPRLHYAPSGGGLGSFQQSLQSQTPVFKLYCTKCGDVRDLK